MNGIIAVNKPKDYTSFDIVAIMKRLCRTKKVGHGGTLDPMATGVLPLFVGAATKAADFSADTDKEYIAGFRLGIATDTQDITGNVIFEKKGYISRNLLIAAKRFEGEIEQIPPMYSAVKIGGQKLYDLARKGIEIEREPRKINVYSIDITEYADNNGFMTVKCSKGTYIRTLIHDIGQELGCGAVMTSLVRVKSSGLELDKSYELDYLKQYSQNNGNLDKLLMPLEIYYECYPRAFLDETQTKRLNNGAELSADRIHMEKVYDGIYGVIDINGRIRALAKIRRDHTLGILQRFSAE